MMIMTVLGQIMILMVKHTMDMMTKMEIQHGMILTETLIQ